MGTYPLHPRRPISGYIRIKIFVLYGQYSISTEDMLLVHPCEDVICNDAIIFVIKIMLSPVEELNL